MQSPAAQAPVHDAVMDSVALRAWVNLPYGSNLEVDLYKAANIVARFTQVCMLALDRLVKPPHSCCQSSHAC
jgi:hypothetical protein